MHEEVDNEVFITSLDFAQELLSYPNAISSLDIALRKGTDPNTVRDALKIV